jgi:tetratricopeptide (TPR) repeat protein
MFLLIAFGTARRAMRGGRWWLWIVALGSWGLALASKEIAVMFPFALLAYDWLVSPATPEERRRRLWTIHGPLIALTLVAAVVRLRVLIDVEHPGTVVQWRFGLVELDVFRRYLQLIVVPVGQTIFHAISPIQSLTAPRSILGFATAALFAATIWRLRKQGVISFGLTWFALLLLPSAALVVLDRGEPMSEQRLYTASAGFFLAAGSLAGLVAERLRQVSGTAVRRARDAAFVIVAILCVQTISRTLVWHRGVTLWLEAAEYAPDHWLPRLALGEALHEEGRHDEAISMFRQSIALRPTEPLAYAKLGECQLETGREQEAAQSFERLRAMDPGSTAAATGLGLIAMRARDSNVARRYFLETLAKDPNSVLMRQALAAVAEETDPGEALRLCEEIQQLAPGTPGNAECITRNRQRLEAAGGLRR